MNTEKKETPLPFPSGEREDGVTSETIDVAQALQAVDAFIAAEGGASVSPPTSPKSAPVTERNAETPVVPPPVSVVEQEETGGNAEQQAMPPHGSAFLRQHWPRMKRKLRHEAAGWLFLLKSLIFLEFLYLVIHGLFYGIIYAVIGMVMLPGEAFETRFLSLIRQHLDEVFWLYQPEVAKITGIMIVGCGIILFLGHMPALCRRLIRRLFNFGPRIRAYNTEILLFVVMAVLLVQICLGNFLLLGVTSIILFIMIFCHDIGRGLNGGRFWAYRRMPLNIRRKPRLMRRQFLLRVLSLIAMETLLAVALSVILSFAHKTATPPEANTPVFSVRPQSGIQGQSVPLP